MRKYGAIRVSRHESEQLTALRGRLIEWTSGQCEGCRAFPETDLLEVHHVVPISQGGALLDPANLQLLCKPCHTAIHTP